MTVTEPIETVVVEKMAAGGDGLGHLADGRVVFVRGGLPGESVGVRIDSLKKDFARATVVEVVDPSPIRTEPPCPALAAGCGGCAWQHVTPEGQLELKTSIVVDALRRTAKLDGLHVAPAASVPPWGYRTSMRLAVAPSGRVGLRAASSHRVIELDDCPIAHPDLAALLAGVRVSGADEVSLRIGVASGEASAVASRPGAVIDGLPEHAGVGPSAVVHERVRDALLQVSAASFFQSGPAAAELLVREVREAADDIGGDTLDAYGGGGLFTAALPLRHAVIVESSRSACGDAAVNAPHADVECTPFEQWAPRPVALAIADPARTGLGREAVAVLVATGARRAVLVSCDPVAFARDAALLVAAGYRHAGSRVLDLFPNTPHVEVVTRFDLAE